MIKVLLLVMLALLAGACAGGSGPAVARPVAAESAVALSPPMRRLWVRDDEETKQPAVVINRVPARLMWDSGAAADIMLFEPALARFGIAGLAEAPAATGPARISPGRTRPVPTRIFGTDDELSLPVAPMAAYADAADRGDGVLGWLAMRQNPWYFATAADVVVMLAAVPEEATRWTRFTLLDRGVMVLQPPGEADARYRFYIDTGSEGGITLPPAEWQAWKTAHPAAPLTIHMQYFIGQGLRAVEQSRARSFRLGGVELKNVVVAEAGPAEYMKDEEPDAVVLSLGLAALDACELVVVPGQHAVYLSPSETGGSLPSRINRLGIGFSEEGERLVARVAPRSPAADAGLRDGDILREIDDHPMAGWRESPAKLNLLRLSALGAPRAIVIERAGRTLTFEVTPRDILAFD